MITQTLNSLNRAFWSVLLAGVFLFFPVSSAFATQAFSPEDRQTRILGVLALHGVSEAYSNWHHLVDYLNREQSRYQFQLRALSFEEIQTLVANKKIDYLIANSAYFIDLRHKHNLQAIATLNRETTDSTFSRFGGLIVTQPHLTESKLLEKPQLKIAAVAPYSFGGYLVQRRKLIEHYNLDPEKHKIQYFYRHEDVLDIMRSGIFDLGFVRTGVFEEYFYRAELKPVFVNANPSDAFPLVRSTILYPEWPFASLSQISSNETKQILPLLLKWQFQFKDEILSWSAPLDYQPVDELFQSLKLPPYQQKDSAHKTFPISWLLGLLAILSGFLFLYRKLRHRKPKTLKINQTAENQTTSIPAELFFLEQADELEAFADAMNEGVLFLNSNYEVVFSNHALKHQLGYEKEHLKGLSVNELFPLPERHKMKILHETKVTGDPCLIEIYPVIKALDHAQNPVSLYAKICKRKIGNQVFYLLLTEDRTLIQTTEKQLQKIRLVHDYYLHNAKDIVFSFDRKFHLKEVSASTTELFKLESRESGRINWVKEFVSEDDIPELLMQLNEAQRTDTSNQISRLLKLKIGKQECVLSVNIAFLNAKDNQLDHSFYLCSAVHLNNLAPGQKYATLESLNFDDVIAKNQAGIIMLNERGIIQLVNPAAQKLLGRSEEDLLDSYFGTPVLSDQGDRTEFDLINPDGSIGVAEVTFSKTEWHGQAAYLVMMYDITRLKEAQKLIQHQALHDALTGLTNRRLFTELLDQTIARHNRTRAPFATLFFDIDGFKKINDAFGHSVGDLLLVQSTQRIQNALKKSDIFARMGGDEFTVLLEEDNDKQSIIDVCESISHQFDTEFSIEGHTIQISISIGIALFPMDSTDSTELLKMADLAMYQAKKQLNRSYDFFHETMLESFTTSYTLENALNKALKKGEFELYYQPQIKTRDGSLCGMEALIRWNNDEMGLVGPDHFIPLLESSGQILQVGAWIMDEAVRQIKEWSQIIDSNIRLAVNVSPLQLVDDNFVDIVKNTLQKHQLPATYLAIEITESTFIGNMNKTLEKLKQLESIGIQIHMDDFGTGYSSMAMLTELPFDVIKIDQSFVKNILNDPRERVMVQAIASTIHAFNRTVLVEGVEQEEQRTILAELGCDEIQGYLFDKPLRAEEFKKKYLAHKKAVN